MGKQQIIDSNQYMYNTNFCNNIKTHLAHPTIINVDIKFLC